jgi:hypothetical protein
MRKLLVLTIATGVLVGGAGIAVADPNVPNIPAHRHFITTPDGKLVQVGPRLCDDPSLQQAFNQFHVNVHESSTSPVTPIQTLGPQHGAPGLHNAQGAELIATGC